MRTQLIFLIVCVVASFALPERSSFADSEIRQHYEGEIELKNDNQGSANANDESVESLDEHLIPSNETTTEKKRCNWVRREQNENHRRWSKHGQDGRHRNRTQLDNAERRHPFIHTSVWQEKQDSPMADETTDGEKRHHRHHHRHHHHHHKNCTTTTTSPTITTSNTPISEMEE